MQAKTAIRSRVMRILASERVIELQHQKARLVRTLQGRAPEVHYFHQVDDPYSHLSVQKLAAFDTHYNLAVIPHLVSAPAAEYQGDASRFPAWALGDAAAIAQGYGVSLATHSQAATQSIAAPISPDATAISAVGHKLAGVLKKTPTAHQAQKFATAAIELGTELWNSTGKLSAMASSPTDTPSNIPSPTASGDHLRKKLGHYQGAMFWFDGEWYWGLDRLHLLEARLHNEGYAVNKAPNARLVAEPPMADQLPATADASNITLTYFPSLRSPYTAIGQARVEDLIKRTGVQLTLKPVMPMLMRGIPAPSTKQRYILQDASREARYYNTPFGNFVDPFGEPVKRAFALYPAAARLGRGMEFVSAYLSAAFAKGIDIAEESGLASVAQTAGLDFGQLQSEAQQDQQDNAWQAELEANVSEMLNAGLWGVPSFVVTGGNTDTAFSVWGQDRIWLVESEITRRSHKR